MARSLSQKRILVTGGTGFLGSFVGARRQEAGAVVLVWSRFPDADQEWVEDRIISNTDEFSKQ